MRSTLRQIDDPHDAPIAPDIVPADWAGPKPAGPANDAASREKLFAEIRHAAEVAAPKVDNTFRASDVNDIPALKKSPARNWVNRAVTAFILALVSAGAAAAWKQHGEAATQTLADWVPLPAASSSPAADPPVEADAQAASEREEVAAQPPAEAAAAPGSTAALPPEAEQQIQSMARELAAMGQQIEQLKATIETLKANQQAAVAPPAPPAARAHPPAPKPRVSAAPKPPAPPRAAYPPAVQAAAAPPPGYQAPQPYPQQATTQPNGEPVVRPPMPMPLSNRY
ncbi:hypothetical protein [Bradyrhizobium sp.]|uniref:hypothetical protein n=1 Tax=Bradyrhizobium sp. TaxID=376 RepID=UPI004037987C